MADKPYTEPVARLLTLGECHRTRWPDYRTLGLGPEHIPELLRMVADPDLNHAGREGAAVWAPAHAWRTLGQLGAVDAVEPLLELLDELVMDDWALEEIPEVMGLIGPAAIPTLRAFLAQPERREYARIGAADALKEIGSRHRAARDECVAALAERLAVREDAAHGLNGFLVSNLLDLDGREALSAMEAAFASGCVDEGVAGGWRDVRRHFGLALSPEDHPGCPAPGRHLEPPGSRRPDPSRAKAKRKKKLAKASQRKNRRR